MKGFFQQRQGHRIKRVYAAAAFWLAWSVSLSFGQPLVSTLGGGPNAFNMDAAGYFDGSLSGESQFNAPGGIALDSSGLIFIADSENSVIRIADLEQDQVYTFSTAPEALKTPVDVAIEEQVTGELFVWVADVEAGSVVRFDAFGNVVSRWNGFENLAALTTESDDAVLVLESDGGVHRIQDAQPGVFNISLLNYDFWDTAAVSASGIVALNDGRVAVSDSGAHVIRLFQFNTDFSVTLTHQFGQEGLAGFRDGNTLSQPLFNSPAHIAKAGNDVIVVADRLNHRVRVLRPQSGLVSTLYGISPAIWGPVYPGWSDGLSTLAEAREPFGITVGAEGQVFATERYYHLLRQVSETPLTGPTDGGAGSNTNLVVAAPVFQPSSGYFPSGTEIRIQNQNTNVFLESKIYYTLDGSDPTTNSLQVTKINDQGEWTLPWALKDVDLTSLRLAASLNGVLSEIVSGVPVAQNSIGVKNSMFAGPGSSVMIPVTVDLKPDVQLRSLQFLVEVTPDARASAPFGFPDPIQEPFTAVTMQNDDFIPLVMASTNPPSLSPDTMVQNLTDAQGGEHQVITKRLAVAYLGTNTLFSAENFAVTAMINVPIPSSANFGDSYTIRIVNPSGTSDGFQNVVDLHALSAKKIYVERTGYLVGDSSPSVWYNATELTVTGASVSGFGNGLLMNDDVNNAFLASLGVRTPFESSDLFDAMDVFPSDITGFTGGDGAIRFLDWQTILRRSLGLDSIEWYRYWQSGERLATQDPELTVSTDGSGDAGLANRAATEENGDTIWAPHGRLEVEHLENLAPGSSFRAAVRLKASIDSQLLGLSFRIRAIPMGAVVPDMAIRFDAAAGIPQPMSVNGLSASDLLCGWSLNSFSSPLSGEVLLGWIEGTLPAGLDAGMGYALSWVLGDGAVAPMDQALLETRSGGVWVSDAPDSASKLITPEWVSAYFGTESGLEIADDADPDHDGMTNLQEYLAGTHPLNAGSSVKLEIEAGAEGVVIRWETVPGKFYQLEGADLASGADLDDLTMKWVELSPQPFNGNGARAEYISTTGETHRYYRLKVFDQ